jgi:hypothetical protein
MRRMGAVSTESHRGLLLKPLTFLFCMGGVDWTLDGTERFRKRSLFGLPKALLLSPLLRDFTNPKCVLSAPVGCILAAAYRVRENLIIHDRADNRNVLIAMLVNRCFLNFCAALEGHCPAQRGK